LSGAQIWYDEVLHQDYRQSLRIETILHREQTAHQDLIIFENKRFGRVLALDGVVQTTEGDEFVYHEMLVHMPILGHGAATDVLVVGGGDGGALREVLRHRAVGRALLVEIDASVIEMCREYLPGHSAGAFDDPRAEIVVADGAAFVAGTERRFDVIIIDSTDPAGPGEVLFSEAFYGDCKRCLRPGGVMVTQNGVPSLQGAEVTNSHKRLGAHFADVAFYLASVPTYAGGVMAFGWASDDESLRETTLDGLASRYAAAGLETRYYNPEVHRAAFALPNTVRALLG